MVDTISPPLVDPIPIPVDAPKRGRGRPPKTDPVTGERINPSRKPPKLSRPRRPTTPKRSRGPRSLRPEIAAFLTLANSLVLGELRDLITSSVRATTEAVAEVTEALEDVSQEVTESVAEAASGAIGGAAEGVEQGVAGAGTGVRDVVEGAAEAVGTGSAALARHFPSLASVRTPRVARRGG